MFDSQPRLDSVLENACHQLRACPFQALPLHRETVGLGGSVATFAVVPSQLVADGALTEPNGLRDLDLSLSGLIHVGDHFTVFRTEAVVFVTHSQFVVKSD